MRKKLQLENRSWRIDLIEKDPPRVRISEADETFELALPDDGRGAEGRVLIEDRYAPYFVTQSSNGVWVTLAGETFFFEKASGASGSEAQHGGFAAPMPGKIIQVQATVGQAVKKGDILIIQEAMKMEHRIEAPCNGVVTAVHCQVGALVDQGFNLLDFQADEAEA